MNSKIKYGLIFFWIFLLLVFGIFPKKIFNIQNIEIQNNDYIDRQYFIQTIKPYLQSHVTIFSLNKKKFIKELQKNPFIDKVRIKVKAFHTLVIHVEVKNIVGVFVDHNKKLLISEKSEILPMVSHDFLGRYPVIEMKNENNVSQLRDLTYKLAIIKYSHLQFFKKISKIDLYRFHETHIFMANSGRKYIFSDNLSLEDFIKIEILESKIQNGSTMIVKGNSITVD